LIPTIKPFLSADLTLIFYWVYIFLEQFKTFSCRLEIILFSRNLMNFWRHSLRGNATILLKVSRAQGIVHVFRNLTNKALRPLAHHVENKQSLLSFTPPHPK
jgi:hypothetical protein